MREPAASGRLFMTTTSNLRVGEFVVACILLWLSWKFLRLYLFFRPRNQHSLRSVAILVLGDIGRSPRMMYHAESFAENGFETNIIGYSGKCDIYCLLLCQQSGRLDTDTFAATPAGRISLPSSTTHLFPTPALHTLRAIEDSPSNCLNSTRTSRSHPQTTRVHPCTSKSSDHVHTH